MRNRPTRSFALALVAAVTLGSYSCQNKATPSTTPETPSAVAATPTPAPPTEVPPTGEPFPPSNVNTTPVVDLSIDQLNQQESIDAMSTQCRQVPVPITSLRSEWLATLLT